MYKHTHAKYCKHYVCFIFLEAVRLFVVFLQWNSKRTTLQAAKNKIKCRSSHLKLFLENKRFGWGLFLSYSDSTFQRCFCHKSHPATLMQFHYFSLFKFWVHNIQGFSQTNKKTTTTKYWLIQVSKDFFCQNSSVVIDFFNMTCTFLTCFRTPCYSSASKMP